MKLARNVGGYSCLEVLIGLAVLAGIVAAALPALADSAAARRGAMAASMIALGNAHGGYNISVQLIGTGSGSVVDDLGEISCEADCNGSYGEEVEVTLTATAAPGSYFAGWSGGGCAGTGPCVITVTDSGAFVTATFELNPTIDVQFDGSGEGRVEFAPGMGLCTSVGGSCSEGFAPGTVVTLTATAEAGSYFSGWSTSGCMGTGPCEITMGTTPVFVTARFTLDPLVDVQFSDSGFGTVTLQPGAFVCSGACDRRYPPGTMVTATAEASVGSFFAGWDPSGPNDPFCFGTGPCQFILDTFDQTVTARFVLNQPPVAVCRNVTIDATGTCASLFIEAADVDDGSSDPDAGLGDMISLSLDFSGPFLLGQTVVTLTVTDLAGATSTCTATITVIADDCNFNGVPDACDVQNGTSLDCNDNWVPDECECFWCNVDPVPTAGQKGPPVPEVNAQVSHLGGGTECGEKVADDFYLEPGCAHRITAVRGRLLTNSHPALRRARLELYEDCNGAPVDEPFFTADYNTPEDGAIASEIIHVERAADGFSVVTYRFDLCDACIWLDGGKTYWVSIIGLTDNIDMVDLSYWLADDADGRIMGNVPVKRSGTPGSTWGSCDFGPWESLEDCCIGCVNMDFCVDGYSCPILWDNGKVDLVTRGGSPSGAHQQYNDRTADSFVVKTCEAADVCLIEAWIWTNCAEPVCGFIELYEDLGCDPRLEDEPFARYECESIDAQRFDETLVIGPRTYHLWRLRVKDPQLILAPAHNYWVSAGARSAGNFNANSFFAWSRYGCSPCNGTDTFRITPGQHRTLRPPATEWADVIPARDFAFTIAVKGPDAIPPDFDGEPDGPLGTPACIADANNDGAVAVDDIFSFLSAWFTGCP